MTFDKWFDTFISEKELDLGEYFEVEGPSGPNFMCYCNVVDAIKQAPKDEQKSIKDMIIRIDFSNGDVRDFLRHLAQAIAI